MRWVHRTILFFVVVGVMTVLQVLVMIAQSSSALSHQRDVLSHQLQTDSVVRPSTVPASPRTSLHDCDREYNTLLGVPPSIRNRSDSQQFTCKAFLFSDIMAPVYLQAKNFMKTHPKHVYSDEYFTEITKDCESYKRHRGYHLTSLSEEEDNYPMAMTLLIHKDLEQTERLIRAIYRPSNVYCIHIDANSPQSMHEALQGIANCFDNVFIASKLEHVVYAGYSRLQADINCMEDLLNSSIQWKYLMNLAGQSFPLMTNAELVKLFKIYNGMNDIEGMTRKVLHGRIDKEWIEINGKTVNKTGRRNPTPPHDIDIVRGSAYGIFSREFVKFILTDQKAKDLLEWSKKTYSPDEHYWATLHHTWSNPHLHTPGGYSGFPDTKPWLAVYAAWGGRDKCYGMWKRGVCVFGVGDLPNLLTQKAAFSNKFYLDHQPLALECMHQWIEYKTRCPIPFDEDFYKNLPFVQAKWKFW